MRTANLHALQSYIMQVLSHADTRLAGNLRQVMQSGGKRLRPLLVFHSAGLINGALDNHALLPLQAALEMIHSASLIHDDIIDDSHLRRGVASLHLRTGEKAAIRHGDYLLALALEQLQHYRQPRLLAILAQCSQEMCLGELQQLQGCFSFAQQTPAHYFLRIRRKTASLFAACCQMGALAGGGTFEQCTALRLYGENLGMAFQIIDDILDFEENPQFGKPQGQDLRQGIYTLPLLYALENAADKEAFMQKACAAQKTAEARQEMIRLIIHSGGLEAARQVALSYSVSAEKAVEGFAVGPAKEALLDIVCQLNTREK